MASKTSRDAGKLISFFGNFNLKFHIYLEISPFLERSLGVDHFNQNGNIKNISHIDCDVNAETENDSNLQKEVQKSDIEMVARESKSKEKKECVAVKEKCDEENDKDEDRFYLFRYPKDKRIWQQVIWLIIWPMELLFVLTIPNCEKKRFRKLFPATFVMCIVWIGSLSYLVAWMITIVGKF